MTIICKACGTPFESDDTSRRLCGRQCVARNLHVVATSATGDDSPRFRHGATVNRKKSPEYNSWRAMRERCNNPNSIRFQYYGGRGIRVASEWDTPHGFQAFFDHLGPKPSPGHSIDRLDPNGNYEPGNVRWATKQEQATENRRPAQPFPQCRRGHPRSPENRVANGGKFGACRACRAMTNANARERKAATSATV